MKKQDRIKKNSQFRYIYSRGKSYSNPNLVLYVMKNRKNSNSNRLGLSVSKKVGNAVTRNRIKRLIREGYRLNKHLFKTGYDFIFIARVASSKANYQDINKSILHLMKATKMLKETND